MKSAEDFISGQVILIDKPLNWPSFQVVNKLRWAIRKAFDIKTIKVGHAGTLDPLATGLLIICTGKMTKQINIFQGQIKEYTGEITLGGTTPSYDLESAFKHIEQGNAGIANRSVIKLESQPALFGEHNFALNEMTIHKNDSSSMITIHAYMDGEFLNSYWADGLIVSTPTGSTAYSMSCGGPIVFPGSNNFIITPVAPHNLNVRPIVIPDKAELSFKVEGRSDSFLISLDSRTEVISSDVTLTVSRHENVIKLIKLPDYSYLKTLRNKLNWGLDTRN